MKKSIALVLVCLMFACALAEPSADYKLAAEVLGTQLTDKWNGRSSEEMDWFVANIQLTNWHPQAQLISEYLSGQLVYRDAYVFEGTPVFADDSIAPLIEKKGNMVFEIPKMVARAFDSGDVRVTITVDGTEQDVPLKDVKPAARREGRLEGPGFDTPEEAVLAYLEGLNNADVTEMLSTFALESYVENADPESAILRMQRFQPLAQPPLYSDYARSLVLSARYGDIARALLNQYEELSTGLNGKAYSITGESRDSVEVFEQFANSPVNQWKGRVEFVDWLEPYDITEHFIREVNLIGLGNQMACCGADDLSEMAARIRLDGQDAIQLMSCVKYDGRWYNYSLQSHLANIIGMAYFQAGLLHPAFFSENAGPEWEMDEYAGRRTLEPDAIRQIDAWEQSDLTGTCWRITDFSMPGIDVCNSADDLQPSGGMGFCAQVRFMHYGIITADLRFSPALASEWCCGFDHVKAAATWTGVDDSVQLSEARVILTRTVSFAAPEFHRSGDTITLIWPDMQATLERIYD